jgi:gastrin-releasing peptide receptor
MVTHTFQSSWSTKRGIQTDSQAHEEMKFSTSEIVTTEYTTERNTNLDGVAMNLHPNVSEMYMAYLIEHLNPLDEAALSETDEKENTNRLLTNQTAVFKNIRVNDVLDGANDSEITAALLQTVNKLTKYMGESDVLTNVTNVLGEANGSSSLSVVLIPWNETGAATEEINGTMDNSTTVLNPPVRWRYVWIHNKVFVSNKTKSTQLVNEHNISWRQSKEYQILRRYVDPTVYSVILVIGLLGNGMLLFIFIRHRKLRTTANIMIINLAVCDILNLSVNAPLHSYFHYEGGSLEYFTSCTFVLALRQYLRCTGALAVIALITQRFSIVVPAFRNSSIHRTPFSFTVLSIVIVWVLPLPIAWPTMYLPDFYGPICQFGKEETGLSYIIVLSFILYCLIMPSIMFGFSSLIAKRLRKSVREMPGEIRHRSQEVLRNRSAQMTMTLAIVFVITYFPFEIWVVLARWVRVDKNTPVMIYFLYLSKHLLFANGCFNPIALFSVSSTFRKTLARHISRSAEQKVYSTKF